MVQGVTVVVVGSLAVLGFGLFVARRRSQLSGQEPDLRDLELHPPAR